MQKRFFIATLLVIMTCMFPQDPVFAEGTQNNASIANYGTTLPSNFKVAPDEGAAKVPQLFYKYLDKHQIDAALNLLVPRIRKIYSGPALMGYMEDIEHAHLGQFHDVTSVWGGIPYDLSPFYRVKVYVGVLDLKMRQHSDVRSGKYVRRLIVVKTSRNAPWQLLMEQTMSRSFVSPFWNLDLDGVSDKPF